MIYCSKKISLKGSKKALKPNFVDYRVDFSSAYKNTLSLYRLVIAENLTF